MKHSLQLNGRHPLVDFATCDRIEGIETVAIHVTPEIAKRLLVRNVRNRKISEKVVSKYVEEIRAGDWRLTPAGIGFDSDGVLVDGQHRLAAIVKSGIAAPLLVTLGLPPASQEKVDRQRRRTLFDALYLSGHAYSRQEVEIATCLTRMRQGSDSGVVPSDSLVKKTLLKHIDSIREVLVGADKKKRGLSQASFLAAAVLYHEIDRKKCAEFLAGVRTGEMLTNDHPAMRLRRFLLGETTVASMPRGGANQSFIFRRAVFAMQAHLEGRKISGLREADGFEVAERMNLSHVRPVALKSRF